LTMDKLSNFEDLKRFLRGMGLHVNEGVVQRVVNALSGKVSVSLYSLYATRPDKPAPLCGKGTVYKIKKLYDKGELEPYLAYLSHSSTAFEAGTEKIKETEPQINNIVQELSALNNVSNILYEYRLKLTVGISELDVPVPTRPVFQELCLKRIIQIEQRRRSEGPRQYDASFWVLTDYGKQVVERLTRWKDKQEQGKGEDEK
jgi:hypothetical protein